MKTWRVQENRIELFTTSHQKLYQVLKLDLSEFLGWIFYINHFCRTGRCLLWGIALTAVAQATLVPFQRTARQSEPSHRLFSYLISGKTKINASVILKQHTSREAGFSQKTFSAALAQPEPVHKLKTVFREGEGATMEGRKQFQCKVNYILDQLVLTWCTLSICQQKLF